MLAQRLMWIAWPAFLLAAITEMLVFALVDPQSLYWFGHPLALSREAVYTLAFFAFWLLAMASSALTTLLAMSPFEINHRQQDADMLSGNGNQQHTNEIN
jgi:membrane protein implicated in regulation of membrane protease activity